MLIAIALYEDKRESFIHPHFGLCNYYGIYDEQSDALTFIANPHLNNPKQVGLHAAQILLERGVVKVIAGRFGSKVSGFFSAKNVQMIIPHNPHVKLDELINTVILTNPGNRKE